jgi:hypothetical protein
MQHVVESQIGVNRTLPAFLKRTQTYFYTFRWAWYNDGRCTGTRFIARKNDPNFAGKTVRLKQFSFSRATVVIYSSA